jgi:anti-sigma regulatory factor (Ser/Thr protein kinase)
MGSDVQRSDVPIESFESRFGAQVHAVSGCRRDFVGWMRGAHLDGGTVDDLAVVFSELAANAVDASASTTDDVDVHARMDRGGLVLEVSNHTERFEIPDLASVPDGEDTLRQRGRGLLIARAFVDSVQMETQPPDRFIVRCFRTLTRRG